MSDKNEAEEDLEGGVSEEEKEATTNSSSTMFVVHWFSFASHESKNM